MTDEEGVEGSEVVIIEIALGVGEAAETFDLEKTVCSHGFFMMPPNQWDTISRTFSRPLRLLHSSSSSSVWVTITQDCVHRSLRMRVQGIRYLSQEQTQSLLSQVARMLRLSERDQRVSREFAKVVEETTSSSCCIRDFGGRVFRSPTLFEDMVKCILLCNCQWSRTLNMAAALCELQLELECQSTRKNANIQENNDNSFIPKTPAKKESKGKFNMCFEAATSLATAPSINDLPESDSDFTSALQSPHRNQNGGQRTGNFPSPSELAKLDERFLAKRCNLGYRASRIIKLAQGVVEGRIPFEEFEQVSDGGCLSSYDKLVDQLREIDGFGPFTSANVLMCMGFYHVIPTDSETVRHVKQVHSKISTIRTIQRDVECIYGKYAPFQFLAYWAELWHFYEQRFGKMSEMRCSDYGLITASNMRNVSLQKTKRIKLS